MIPFGQAQHLGPRAFALIMIRNVLPAIAFLFLASIVLGLRTWLAQSLALSMDFTAGTAAAAPLAAADYINWFILALYILAVILFLFGLILSVLVYLNYTFKLEEFDLKLRRGILNIEEVSIPYRQVQDVNIIRSLFYRILGVSRIIIDSAGHEEAEEDNETDITLEPIDKELAEKIRTILERRVGVQIVKDETAADADDKKPVL
jgi:uncharacterized membrane protein YdbT with pleckstrin-like domain